ncbi:BamA/TamA family outer membrane protein [Algoriphagus namhaensis]|uniref:BamA/TamA family outer membrane protein n=1 Tax=Algoriphagus namhaensis TaxID=915353 RepID=A0ABV8APT6_9BACT
MNWSIRDGVTPDSARSFVSKDALAAYMDSVLLAQQRIGYLSAFWESETRMDSTKAVLDLGPQIEKVSIETGNLPLNYLKELGQAPVSYQAYDNWVKEVLSLAENDGFPFANIQLTDLQRAGDSLRGVVDFDPGPLITWDSLKVVGDSRTSARYLQNLSLLNPGEAFSQKEFEKATRQISRSPYFRLASEPQIAFQQRKAQPIFELRDRNSNVLDGIIGILPNENEPGKVLITGQLDLELYHLGGKGRDIALHWQRLNIQTQSLDLSYHESFLFGSPISASLGFSLLKQDSTFLNRFFDLNFGYRPSRDLNLSFFTKRQSSDLIFTADFSEITVLPEVADYRWNQYGLALDWNALDSPELPRNGVRVRTKFAAGNKRIVENTAFPENIYNDIELNTPQYSLQASVEKHLFIKPAWGMWIHGSLGFIENQNLLLNDLFRIGGLKTIRGFNENFFYARSFAFVNFEQRFFFGERSFLMVFGDAGFVENPFAEQTQDFPVSVGTGITLDTGNGLFKFILGVGSANEQPFSFTYSRIHFGYVARF